MKFIFRWAFRFMILVIVLAVAGILLLDTIAREVIEYQVRNQTGLETKVGHVHVGLFTPVMTIDHFVLYNSAAFGGSPFIDLPELHVEYDRDALRSGKLHCKLVRINLAIINLVEDKNGRSNLELLEQRLKMPGRSNHAGHQAGRSVSSMEFTGIDTLNLTLGKATHLRMDQPRQVDEFKMNVDHQVFNNIKSDQDFSNVLLVALLRSNASVLFGGKSSNFLRLLAPPKK